MTLLIPRHWMSVVTKKIEREKTPTIGLSLKIDYSENLTVLCHRLQKCRFCNSFVGHLCMNVRREPKLATREAIHVNYSLLTHSSKSLTHFRHLAQINKKTISRNSKCAKTHLYTNAEFQHFSTLTPRIPL